MDRRSFVSVLVQPGLAVGVEGGHDDIEQKERSEEGHLDYRDEEGDKDERQEGQLENVHKISFEKLL